MNLHVHSAHRQRKSLGCEHKKRVEKRAPIRPLSALLKLTVLHFTEQSQSFGTTWGWINNDTFLLLNVLNVAQWWNGSIWNVFSLWCVTNARVQHSSDLRASFNSVFLLLLLTAGSHKAFARLWPWGPSNRWHHAPCTSQKPRDRCVIRTERTARPSPTLRVRRQSTNTFALHSLSFLCVGLDSADTNRNRRSKSAK